MINKYSIRFSKRKLLYLLPVWQIAWLKVFICTTVVTYWVIIDVISYHRLLCVYKQTVHNYCSQSWTNSYQSNWHTCYIWPTLRFSPKIGWSQKSAGLLRAPHYGRNHRIVFKNYDTFCTNKGYFYLANETNQHLLNSLMVQFNQISLPFRKKAKISLI